MATNGLVTMHTSRRQLLKAGLSGLLLPFAPRLLAAETSAEPVTFGVIADLHHGLAPDAQQRLETFLAAAEQARCDAIIQLGDFNYADAASTACTRLWQQFRGPRYHVLGNHDMDKVNKAAVAQAWQMPGRFYSFDRGGFHFIVLDRNNLKTADGYIPYAQANFYVAGSMRAFADPPQLEWLTDDLARTDKPTVVFVHQGLGLHDEAAANADHPNHVLEKTLEQPRFDGRPSPVVACFCGHHHVDRHRLKHGVHYVWLNSASYHWVGAQYGRMAFYEESLFAMITFDPRGAITIHGRESTWRPPTPADRGFPGVAGLAAKISDRQLAFDQPVQSS
jgi:3',5'-cyclic AMP phosphodiesterase CpdA